MKAMIVKRLVMSVLSVALVAGIAPARIAAQSVAAQGVDSTPPRLSYAEGEVSFWRPGAQEWAPAQVNTPLAPGDELFSGNGGTLEVQVAPRAYVRAWGDTQLGFVSQEPDFLQLKVTSGHVSLDIRQVEPGRTIEVNTPGAAFTIDRPGYYRVDVVPPRTSFVTRRAGQATMTSAQGAAVTIAPGERVVIDDTAPARVEREVTAALDQWDRWNDARTAQLLGTESSRYVSSEVYGLDELDRHGRWRTVPTYGSVWVPTSVPADWAPYSTGKWIWDPRYGWTWVDTARWGWAPYHYGRWVYVDNVWGWAPGPIVRPVFAPALVAFFGLPGVRVGITVPAVSWVPLGWGEPVVPWWGRPGFVGRPWWGGWGGPRVVNNVVINRTTIVNVEHIHVYRNVNVRNAVVAVREDDFGRRGVHQARLRDVDARGIRPLVGPLHLKPAASSFVAGTGHGVKPPDALLHRRVVTTPRRALPDVRDRQPDRGDDRRDGSDRRDGTDRRDGPDPRERSDRRDGTDRQVAPPAGRPERGAAPEPQDRRPERSVTPAPQDRRPERSATPEPRDRRPERSPAVDPRDQRPERGAVSQPQERRPEGTPTPDPRERPERGAAPDPRDRRPERSGGSGSEDRRPDRDAAPDRRDRRSEPATVPERPPVPRASERAPGAVAPREVPPSTAVGAPVPSAPVRVIEPPRAASPAPAQPVTVKPRGETGPQPARPERVSPPPPSSQAPDPRDRRPDRSGGSGPDDRRPDRDAAPDRRDRRSESGTIPERVAVPRASDRLPAAVPPREAPPSTAVRTPVSAAPVRVIEPPRAASPAPSQPGPAGKPGLPPREAPASTAVGSPAAAVPVRAIETKRAGSPVSPQPASAVKPGQQSGQTGRISPTPASSQPPSDESTKRRGASDDRERRPAPNPK